MFYEGVMVCFMKEQTFKDIIVGVQDSADILGVVPIQDSINVVSMIN